MHSARQTQNIWGFAIITHLPFCRLLYLRLVKKVAACQSQSSPSPASHNQRRGLDQPGRTDPSTKVAA